MPESNQDAFKLQCGSCFKYFNASQETWVNGGIVTCPHCGTKRRFTAHAQRVNIPPLTEIKLWGKKRS